MGRVIVLGADGLDAGLLARWLRAGELPNLAALLAHGSQGSGGWSPLRTTNPAESPVAWASFATGLNPGQHGIYDFLQREARTYTLHVGPIAIRPRPDGNGLWAVNRRHGQTFWQVASQAGKRCVLLRVPGTCPPEPLRGRMLSGLGVPDLLGSWGTSWLYTTAQGAARAQLIRLPAAEQIETTVSGPQDITLPLLLRMEDDALRLECQGQVVRLHVREWSPWLTLRFPSPSGFLWEGIARFYLWRLRPELALYLSPLNVDPRHPCLPLSYPEAFAGELVARHGLFSTLGWPEDAAGLDEGRLDEAGFLQQAYEAFAAQEEMTLGELERGDWDLLISVFEATDRVQHMFWPMDKMDGDWSHILAFYRRFDESVGKIASRLRPGDKVLIVSDHGFSPVHRLLHLNAWLRNEGYLYLWGGISHGRWSDIDWSRTRAYAVGLSKIYINLRGREGRGIVKPGREYIELCQEIADRLLTWRDEETGEPVVRAVYHRDKLYTGARMEEAGDLVLGLRRGYRTSQQTAVGSTPSALIVPNERRWRADHCSVDPPLVPGVLGSNCPLELRDPSILDLAPTILDLLGVPSPADMEGRSLCPRGEIETP